MWQIVRCEKKTNNVSDHIRGTGHSRALSLQQKRQTTLQLRGSGIQGKPFFALYCFYIIIYNNIIKYAFFSRRSVQPRSCKYLDRRRITIEKFRLFVTDNACRPVATRFGTWLNAVSYLVKHWKALLDFLKGLDDCDSAVNAIEIMEKPDIIARIGYVHNVEFLCGYITESEARNYTIPKAEIAIQKMTEK